MGLLKYANNMTQGQLQLIFDALRDNDDPEVQKARLQLQIIINSDYKTIKIKRDTK